jgi:hypothetical protein
MKAFAFVLLGLFSPLAHAQGQTVEIEEARLGLVRSEPAALAADTAGEDPRLPSSKLAQYKWFMLALPESRRGAGDQIASELKRQKMFVAPDQQQELEVAAILDREAKNLTGSFATVCRDDRSVDHPPTYFSRCFFLQFATIEDYVNAKPVVNRIKEEYRGIVVIPSGPVIVR